MFNLEGGKSTSRSGANNCNRFDVRLETIHSISMQANIERFQARLQRLKEMHDMEIHAHGYEKQLRGRGIELTYQSLVSQQLHMVFMPMRSFCGYRVWECAILVGIASDSL